MHDRAVKTALAGSALMPVEIREHLEHCDRCRREIEALRALEAGLRAASPVPARDPEWEARLVARTVASAGASKPPVLRSLHWRAAAAAILLAAGFAGSLSLLRLQSPGRSVQANLSATEKQAVARGLDATTYESGEGSTAALLGLTEASVGKEVAKQPANDLEDYFVSVDTGGWNG